ncbi:hypothetical protein SAMN04489716_5106 [Actinoplanes derwentensis]|uniref:Uncharacterized protein n=2 Tax=Actinoplanes derwentensis TaxID=113562 RepID=A0A1H2C0P7_9ACTN|nr:hypothetical protein SAMN04489716_5106 [Actinoplanes derwentensis]
MSLWDSVRDEVAGAWRSVCYDLERPSAVDADPRPDVTCTGMNTFPGSLISLPIVAPETDARPPRRFVAVAAFCALAAGGAAGSYLVATTAFAGRMTDPPTVTPVAAAPMPPTFENEPDRAARDTGMGAVPAPPRIRRTVAPTPETPVTTAPPTTPPSSPTSVRASENRTEGGLGTDDEPLPWPDTSDCDCEAPPVPTPTAPDPGPSPSDSASAPEPGVSPEPAVSETAPDTRGDRRHRWHQPG